MLHTTPRELTRRWYGQIKEQPAEITKEASQLIAHTIIPTKNSTAFGSSYYASLSACIDLILFTEMNSANEVSALTIEGYRSSYNMETNIFKVGGQENLVIKKDMRLRPLKGAKAKAIDPENESAILMSAMEMDAERELSSRYRHMQKRPTWAGAALSYTEDRAPKFNVNPGLKDLALQYLDDPDMTRRVIKAPLNYRGSVNRIMRDLDRNVTIIELTSNESYNDMDLVFELPRWSNVVVRQGQPISPNDRLASLSFPKGSMESFYKMQTTDPDILWSAASALLSDLDAKLVLQAVWSNEVQKWANMMLVPIQLVDTDQAKAAVGVWRDLRCSLGRVCHSPRTPNEIVRASKNEGQMSVWDINSEGSYWDLPNSWLTVDVS